jgi:hypothetical protein
MEVVQTRLVDVTDVTLQAAPPTETVAPTRNPVPVKVMEVPPARGPAAGETDEMVGAT